ncbi:MAG: hypothetical protein ACJAU0_000277 [Flavobacteriales bacterium]|jgi:hypothetical protein
MKTLITSVALLLTISVSCQLELTSIGLNAKTDRLNFKDSQMLGYELTLQMVINNHFLLNTEYSQLDPSFSEFTPFYGPELGTFPDEICTLGGNIGYRFTPHEQFAFDLTGGLFYYKFNERVVYDTQEVPNGWFPYTAAIDKWQATSGLGSNLTVRANWLFSKYVGLNFGIGIQNHQHTEPYIQFGLEIGKLRGFKNT